MYGVTASGKRVEEGVTVACPPRFPFGTRIHIPYFDNTFTCTDRGGAIKGKRLDVYIPELNKALRFGRRQLLVKIEEGE